MSERNQLRLVDKYQFNEKMNTAKNEIDEFDAIHIDTKQQYTLKRICIANQGELNKTSSIMNQLATLKKLNFPYIPKCNKLLKTSNNVYLIFDRIVGVPLSKFIEQDLKRSPAQNQFKICLKIIEELCSFLAYLADKKICHAAINLDNILIEKQKISKIVNYSYSQELGNDQTLIQQNHKNRPCDSFCPPQIKIGTLSIKTDVYSLGVIIQKIFTYIKQSIPTQPASETLKNINNVLVFCKRILAPKAVERITPLEVLNFILNKQYSQKEQDNKRLSVRIPHPDKKQNSMNNTSNSSHSPSNIVLKLISTNHSDIRSQTEEYLYTARKVLNKRNLSYLFLQLSQLCSSSPQCSNEFGNIASFLLLKKSALIVSQLAKFLSTGRGLGLKIQQKAREKLKKYNLFGNLQKTVLQELSSLKEKLSKSAEQLSQILEQYPNGELTRELKVQEVNEDYLKKCISSFQDIIFSWYDCDEKLSLKTMFNKKELSLFLVVTLLGEFSTLEKLYDHFFSESGCSLWQESFFIQLLHMEESEIEGLVLLAKPPPSIKNLEKLESSSRSITISQKYDAH